MINVMVTTAPFLPPRLIAPYEGEWTWHHYRHTKLVMLCLDLYERGLTGRRVWVRGFLGTTRAECLNRCADWATEVAKGDRYYIV